MKLTSLSSWNRMHCFSHMCINSITMKAKEYYFASIFVPHNNDVLSPPSTCRFLARVRSSLPGTVFSRHFGETEMAWLLRNVVVTKLIDQPVFDRHVTTAWITMSESALDVASGETKKKSAKASTYQYGTLCPHVTMVRYRLLFSVAHYQPQSLKSSYCSA